MEFVTLKTIYTYFISSHGEIVTAFDRDNKNKISTIKIPDDVDIFTYTDLGKMAWGMCNTSEYVCKSKKNFDDPISTPAHKYQTQFPQLYLAPDSTSKRVFSFFPYYSVSKPLHFYSGIVHCIPESKRTLTETGQVIASEIIHNMDADPYKECSDKSISSKFQERKKIVERPYNSYGKYSEHYINILKQNGSKRNYPLNLTNKCGDLYLNEAIAIIIDHCNATYPDDYKKRTIQIHVEACLQLAKPNYLFFKPTVYPGEFLVPSLDYFQQFAVKDTLYVRDTEELVTYLYNYYGIYFLVQAPRFDDYRRSVYMHTISKSLINAYKAFRSKLKNYYDGLPRNKEIVINIKNAQDSMVNITQEILNELLTQFRDKVIYDSHSAEVPPLYEGDESHLRDTEEVITYLYKYNGIYFLIKAPRFNKHDLDVHINKISRCLVIGYKAFNSKLKNYYDGLPTDKEIVINITNAQESVIKIAREIIHELVTQFKDKVISDNHSSEAPLSNAFPRSRVLSNASQMTHSMPGSLDLLDDHLAKENILLEQSALDKSRKASIQSKSAKTIISNSNARQSMSLRGGGKKKIIKRTQRHRRIIRHRRTIKNKRSTI